MKPDEKKKTLWVVGGIAMTVAACVITPRLVKTLGNKIYQAESKKEEIDFDSMGPEIVRREDIEEE